MPLMVWSCGTFARTHDADSTIPACYMVIQACQGSNRLQTTHRTVFRGTEERQLAGGGGGGAKWGGGGGGKALRSSSAADCGLSTPSNEEGNSEDQRAFREDDN